MEHNELKPCKKSNGKTRRTDMLTKEQITEMPIEEVAKLFRKKQISCKTCAEEVEMYYTDQEYIMLKERLLERND